MKIARSSAVIATTVALCACADELAVRLAVHGLYAEQPEPATRNWFPAPPLPDSAEYEPLDTVATQVVRAQPLNPSSASQTDYCRTFDGGQPPVATSAPPPDPHARAEREPTVIPEPHIGAGEPVPADPEAAAEVMAALGEVRRLRGVLDDDSLERELIATALAIESRHGTRGPPLTAD